VLATIARTARNRYDDRLAEKTVRPWLRLFPPELGQSADEDFAVQWRRLRGVADFYRIDSKNTADGKILKTSHLARSFPKGRTGRSETLV
jgi:hypothetical protein